MKHLLLVIAFLFSLVAVPLSVQAVPSGSTLADAATSIDDYYREFFAFQGLDYHPPTIVITTEDNPYSGECSENQPVWKDFVAFYCPLDEYIVLEKSVMDTWAKEYDSFVPMVVMAHEWGHHIQKLMGMDSPPASCAIFFCASDDPDPGDWDLVYTIELEQMADCLAGSWTGYLEDQDILNDSDLSSVLYFMATTLDGGGISTGPFDHGVAVQRINALMRGYEHGFFGCMTLNPLDAVPPVEPESDKTPEATPPSGNDSSVPPTGGPH